MKNKKLLLILLIIFIVLIFLIKNILYLGVTISTNKIEYKQKETIEVSIINNSWHKIYINEIFSPHFNIEKFDNGNWIEVSTGKCVGWCTPSGPLVLLPKETKKNIWRKSPDISDGRFRAKIKASIFPREYDAFMELEKDIYSEEFVIR